MAKYWRMIEVDYDQKETIIRWGLTWLQVQERLHSLRTCGIFSLTATDVNEPHYYYNLQGVYSEDYFYSIEIKPDTEYVPDLVGKFFGGKSGNGND